MLLDAQVASLGDRSPIHLPCSTVRYRSASRPVDNDNGAELNELLTELAAHASMSSHLTADEPLMWRTPQDTRCSPTQLGSARRQMCEHVDRVGTRNQIHGVRVCVCCPCLLQMWPHNTLPRISIFAFSTFPNTSTSTSTTHPTQRRETRDTMSGYSTAVIDPALQDLPPPKPGAGHKRKARPSVTQTRSSTRLSSRQRQAAVVAAPDPTSSSSPHNADEPSRGEEENLMRYEWERDTTVSPLGQGTRRRREHLPAADYFHLR